MNLDDILNNMRKTIERFREETPPPHSPPPSSESGDDSSDDELITTLHEKFTISEILPSFRCSPDSIKKQLSVVIGSTKQKVHQAVRSRKSFSKTVKRTRKKNLKVCQHSSLAHTRAPRTATRTASRTASRTAPRTARTSPATTKRAAHS